MESKAKASSYILCTFSFSLFLYLPFPKFSQLQNEPLCSENALPQYFRFTFSTLNANPKYTVEIFFSKLSVVQPPLIAA